MISLIVEIIFLYKNPATTKEMKVIKVVVIKELIDGSCEYKKIS
jgi:hypothetical protein